MLFERLATLSTQIAATSARKKKVALLAALLPELAVAEDGSDERAIAPRYLAGETGHKLGIGYATVGELHKSVPPAQTASLSIVEVERRLAAIAELVGPGSAKGKREIFGGLLAAMTRAEQDFVSAIALGELRQGANDALVVDAVAMATSVPVAAMRMAYMLAGDIGVVAAAALAEGAVGVARFGLTLFRPILPMLAQTAEDTAEALESIGGPMSLEHKLDGFRLQIHKDGDVVRAFSRGLNDVSREVPDLLELVRGLPANRLILDGEAIAYRADGRPLPFQDTMQRKSVDAVAGGTQSSKLVLSLFDTLLVDNDTLLARPSSERYAIMQELAPTLAIPRIVTADAAEAAAFYDAAVAKGHEGVMAKALDAPYDAGHRGAAWLKIKRVLRLDLVVLAVEWGSGRRKGWLSNIHLGARDPAMTASKTGWVMLGKTFKGMTDAMLKWQTEAFLAREVDRDGHVVYVRPEVVAEVAFNDVQRSSQYPGGFALRHARVVRYRDDKTADQADTIDAIRAIAIADGVIDSPA